MRMLIGLLALALSAAPVSQGLAHPGRRFEVIVQGDQLAAQGYLTPGTPDDGGGNPRPYLNAIHGHWTGVGGIASVADLPSFDVFDPAPAELVGGSLTLELLGASKWVNPPADPMGVTPMLVPLGVGETISVQYGGTTITTSTLGALLLSANIPATGAEDLDLLYSINGIPSNVIYALEWRLASSAPGVADSESIYTVLAPMGHDYHHAALHLEEFLGIEAVPEPSSVVLLSVGAIGVAIVARRRRR
ncbi:MAG: PEP-CTERM sorting domain-containing protein [Pirellulales bacterium]|nr:PEP-CTERM sorting domain-containing protein [Pirellulales bacterium]